MDNNLDIARRKLLEPGELDERGLEQLLASLLAPSVDNADLYFQFRRDESWVLEDGIVKEGNHSIEQGAGARAMAGDKTGFAYSDELLMPALKEASAAARAIARSGANGSVQAWQQSPGKQLYAPIDPMDSVESRHKVEWLRRIDVRARAADPRIKQVVVSMAANHNVILVAASDGTLAADVRPLVRLNVQVIAEQGDRRESGVAGCGGRYGYERVLCEEVAFDLAEEAVRAALVNLEAIAAPAGNMTVVLGPGWPGVLLHEAIGHGLEGDFNRKGTSAFAGRLGEKIATDSCTVVDDGTLSEQRGSLNIDDEGVSSQHTVLIENGRLKGYMQDKLNARLTGGASTGNGRRESFAHVPMPRMTNTYMLPGSHDPEEIIQSVQDGLYAVNFGGGQVDITSGQFVFSASEAYLIKNGKITSPVKGATLIGSGPDVLTRVTMVGNDLELDAGDWGLWQGGPECTGGRWPANLAN